MLFDLARLWLAFLFAVACKLCHLARLYWLRKNQRAARDKRNDRALADQHNTNAHHHP